MATLPTTTVEGTQQTAYDVQRRQIADEERRNRQQQSQALQRRLAGSGFTRGSGMLEGQESRQEQDLRMQEQARLGQVDVAQLQAEQAAREAEAGRGLTREQMAQQAEQFGQSQAQTAALTREQMAQTGQQFGQTMALEQRKLTSSENLTREQMMQELGLTEAEMRQREEEFYAGQEMTREQMLHEYNIEATRLNATAALENARNSIAYREIASREGVAAAERQAQMDIVTKQMQDSAAERTAKYGELAAQREQEATQWAQQFGLDEYQTKQTAELARDQFTWEQAQKDEDQAWAQSTYIGDQNFEKSMALLNDKIATGQMTLEDAINDANEAVKVKMDSLYARGANGEIIDTSRMSPMELSAYNMGLAGQTKEEFDRTVNNQAELRNAMVINAAEPEVVQRIEQIYASFGIY